MSASSLHCEEDEDDKCKLTCICFAYRLPLEESMLRYVSIHSTLQLKSLILKCDFQPDLG